MTADTKKNDQQLYQIKFSGRVDDDFVTSFCPPGLTIERDGDITFISNIRTDQSGMIGLIRHLHNLGCTILSINC